jgi:ABC-2 type transport system permease protein
MSALSRHADQILLGLAAAAGALVAVVAFFLLARVIATGLLKKELKHFFYSPIAWLVMAGFALVNGYFFLFVMDYYAGTFANVPFATAYFGEGSFLWILLLMLIPAITMRLIAEEKATGTLEGLMTAPVRDSEVVFAKFAAALIFYLVLWVPFAPLIASLYYYGLPHGAWHELSAQAAAGGWSRWQYASHAVARLNEVMDVGPFASLAVGLTLVGAAWISIGLLASSFAKNQVVAFMSAFVVLMLLYLVGYAEGLVREDPAWFPNLRETLRYVSFVKSFARFPYGLIDTRAVVYFTTLTVVALFFTVRVVESRKWR